MAFFVFGLCLWSRLRQPRIYTLMIIFALGMVYLMLFNSRTENNDYIMVAPAIAFTCMLAWDQKYYGVVVFHLCVMLALILNWSLCKVLTPHHSLWLSPLVVTCYGIYITAQLIAKTGIYINKKSILTNADISQCEEV